jgi:hypothetical protein
MRMSLSSSSLHENENRGTVLSVQEEIGSDSDRLLV